MWSLCYYEKFNWSLLSGWNILADLVIQWRDNHSNSDRNIVLLKGNLRSYNKQKWIEYFCFPTIVLEFMRLFWRHTIAVRKQGFLGMEWLRNHVTMESKMVTRRNLKGEI